MSVRSLSLALKSLWFKKNPSTALSKTTTLSSLVGLQRRDDLPEFENEFRTHQIERRIVECDPPISRRDRVSFICAIFAVSFARAFYSNTAEML